MVTATTISRPRTARPATQPVSRPAFFETVTGEVVKIKFRDQESGFLILELQGGNTVQGEDPDYEIDTQRTYRFAGRWETSGRWGRRFKFDLAVLDVPSYRTSMINYLADNTSIGYEDAAKLWDRYGSGAVHQLTDNVDKVVLDTGLTRDFVRSASATLKRLAADEQAKIDLFKLLSNRGFARKLTARLVRLWGPLAAEKVKADPLKLATLFQVPLKRADRLYCDLGLPPDDLKRQALWAAFGANQSDGSTWVLRAFSEDAIYNNCGRHHERIAPDRAITLAVRGGIMAERSIDGNDVVSSKRRAEDENVIAERIKTLAKTRPIWPALPNDAGLSDHQTDELGKAISGSVGLFLGTPGTGKTFSSAALVRGILHQYGRDLIAVCAPTGKAAVRCQIAMQQAGVEIEATTIHRLLGYRPDAGFEFNEFSPLRHKFIVVDESSMIDAALMGALLLACAPGTHVLFIGDPYQLPPVGHGAPLRDFQAAGLPCGLLTKIRRNAGMIVSGCANIKDGRAPEFTEKLNLATGKNLRLIHAPKSKDTIDRLAALIEKIRDKHAADPNGEGTWHPVWQVQVLVAANKRSDLARNPVNDLLQKLLNGQAGSMGEHDFRVGDKVICLRNGNYMTVEMSRDHNADFFNASTWVQTKADRTITGKAWAESYVANGEIGECMAIAPSSAVFQFEGQRAVRINVTPKSRMVQGDDDDTGDADRGRGCNFDLAYAITCHKSQGSGWPVVIVLMDDSASLIASREWHYTAISRAERMCIMIGRKEVIEKQIRRVSLQGRVTALTELVKGALS